MRPCPTPSPSPSWRPPTSPPATRATGSTSRGPGACRPMPRRLERDAADRRGRGPRAARGHRCRAGATDLSPEDARALGAMPSRDRDRLRARRRAAGRTPHRACLVRRRLGVGRGHRGRRNGPPGASRGLLRDARGRPRGRRRAPGRPADPGPTGDRARRGEAATPVPGPRAAVAGDRRRRFRSPGGRGRSAVALPGAAPGITRSLGRRRLPHRRQRAGARAGRWRRRAVGRGRPRGVAGRGDDARPRAGRGGDRAVGLVVAGR